MFRKVLIIYKWNGFLKVFTLIDCAATIDNTPPVISGCPSSITVNSVSDNNQVSVTWLEPTATDNSGQIPTVVSSRSPGDMFPIGSTVVGYTFVDGNNNPATCTFTVTVIGKESASFHEAVASVVLLPYEDQCPFIWFNTTAM